MGLGPDSITNKRLIWCWAFVEQFGISPEQYDALTIERFEAGITFIEQAKARAAQQ